MPGIKEEVDFSKFMAKSPEAPTQNPQLIEGNNSVLVDTTVSGEAERKKKILYIIAVLVLVIGTFVVLFFFYRTTPPDTIATPDEVKQFVPNYKPSK